MHAGRRSGRPGIEFRETGAGTDQDVLPPRRVSGRDQDLQWFLWFAATRSPEAAV